MNRGYQFGVLRPDGRLASFTGVGAPTVYRGDRLPGELYGNVFVAEPAGNLISRITCGATTPASTPRGLSGPRVPHLHGRAFQARVSVLGADGTLYIVDIYRGIIQHKGYITAYLRDQIQSRGLEQPVAHGRIYRVMHDSMRRGPIRACRRLQARFLSERSSTERMVA